MMRTIILILTVLLFSRSALAQPQSLKGSDYPEPRILVVLLPYANQRIQTLLANGNRTDAQAMARDYAEMRKYMIEDFQDNFDYCPYYFMPDSEAYSFRDNNSWANAALLDSKMAPVSSSILQTNDSSIYFVQYGLRQRPVHTVETMTGGTEQVTGKDEVETIFPSLVLLNYRLEQMPRKVIAQQIRGRGRSREYTSRKPKWAYYYRSRQFRIAYNLSVPVLMRYMTRFFGAPSNGL